MNGKFLVNVSFDLVYEGDTEKLSNELHKMFRDFAKEKALFVSNLSIYQQKNPVTGEPLKVNDDGSVYVEKFEIKNLVTPTL